MQKKKLKPRGKLQKLRADKTGNIDQDKFNFLENLLVFRTLEELSVPPESSVKFRITREEAEDGICLLIHVDNQAYPIFGAEEVRPDYLAVYLHGSGCICTIIEMKSKAGKNLKHGLEQIKMLADRLKREFGECLPPRFGIHVQGILLSQFNSEVPGETIAQMAARGLTILPIQYSHRAELFPYISQRNTLKTRFENKPRHPAPRSSVEALLSTASLRQRLIEPEDALGTQAKIRLQINYVLSDKDEYATLTIRDNQCAFLVSEEGTVHAEQLQQDIERNGLQRKFLVEAVPR